MRHTVDGINYIAADVINPNSITIMLIPKGIPVPEEIPYHSNIT